MSTTSDYILLLQTSFCSSATYTKGIKILYIWQGITRGSKLCFLQKKLLWESIGFQKFDTFCVTYLPVISQIRIQCKHITQDSLQAVSTCIIFRGSWRFQLDMLDGFELMNVDFRQCFPTMPEMAEFKIRDRLHSKGCIAPLSSMLNWSLLLPSWLN